MRSLKSIAGAALVFAALGMSSAELAAEPVNEIVVGGFYYVKGFFEDTKVQVISVDRLGKRVKIYDEGTQSVDWVSAESVITRSESVDRDVDRIQIGARILGAIFESVTRDDGAAVTAPAWTPGAAHPKFANVIAAADRNEWRPAVGYAWAKDGSGRVEWMPGLVHPTAPGKVSGLEEGKWVTEVQFVIAKAQQDGKREDEARKEKKPDPPDVTGVLFEPGEFDIYCRADELDSLFFFHGKPVAYQDIRHVVFHGEDHWVVVVFKDGRRLDLGAKIAWLVRPCLNFATRVTFGRTRDGETLATWRVPLLRVDSKHKVVERYLLGFRFARDAVVTGAGKRRALYEVMEESAALEAGLRKGDAIVSIDGGPVERVEDVLKIVDEKKGEPVEVEYWRGGKAEKVLVKPRMGAGVVRIAQ